jgi:hypothetical protein
MAPPMVPARLVVSTAHDSAWVILVILMEDWEGNGGRSFGATRVRERPIPELCCGPGSVARCSPTPVTLSLLSRRRTTAEHEVQGAEYTE